MTKRVDVVLDVEKSRVKCFCFCDFYECFRSLRCHSRFCYPIQCPRFFEVHNGSFTPKIPKLDFQREFALKRKERC